MFGRQFFKCLILKSLSLIFTSLFAYILGITFSFLIGVQAASAKIELPNQTKNNKAVRVEAVELQLVANYQNALRNVDGQTPALQIGVLINHEPHWHTYWRNPGDSGLPTQIAITGAEVGEIQWPAPKRLPVGPLMNYGYEGQVLLPLDTKKITDARGFISAKVQWLMCKDVCIPGEAELSLQLPVLESKNDSGAKTDFYPLFEEAHAKRPQPLQASYALSGSGANPTLQLLLANTKDGKDVSFYPFEPELIQAPAAQPLFALADGAMRLDLSIAEGAKIPASLNGLLVADGKSFTVTASKVDGQPAWASAGRLVNAPASTNVAQTSVGDQSLFITLAFAFIGGLILNLMPCVFPVLGLKVLGFAATAESNSRTKYIAATMFAIGVLVSFWMLAAIMVGLQTAGESVGWGFQLQSPMFIVAMAWLFTLIGLNLLGAFEVGLGLTQLGGEVRGGSGSKPNWHSEFGGGVLAVLVATPCTAPFMGAALGASLGQSVGTQWLIFTALAIGMATPYVLLTVIPGASRLLPRPGAWMETFKQVLAFPMFGTVAWLIWVLGQQIDVDAVLKLLLSIVLISFAAWLDGRWQKARFEGRGVSKSAWFQLAGMAGATLASVWLIVSVVPSDAGQSGSASKTANTVAWQPWSAALVQSSLAEGKPVFVDFTAAWCVSCQANKKAVLEREAMQQFFEKKQVVLLKADWTKRDATIAQELAKYGRNGVPLYQVWLPGVSAPVLLPELLTQSIVQNALNAAR